MSQTKEKTSKMMAQYRQTKLQYQDAILFWRLGDFYEMFDDDAILVSRLLDLTLTGRSAGGDQKAPMCGIPYHAAESYIAKLIKLGYKVAIGEQLTDPTRGPVERGVVRVITPGTVPLALHMPISQRANFLLWNIMKAYMIVLMMLSLKLCLLKSFAIFTPKK